MLNSASKYQTLVVQLNEILVEKENLENTLNEER